MSLLRPFDFLGRRTKKGFCDLLLVQPELGQGLQLSSSHACGALGLLDFGSRMTGASSQGLTVDDGP